MARIESYTLEQIGLTVHRVCGALFQEKPPV